MVRHEELKTMPMGLVWEEYLKRQGVEADYYSKVKEYEEKVLVNRV